MARIAFLKLAGAALMGLAVLPAAAWASITTDPTVSSSTHTANVTSTASDISLSWTAGVSDKVSAASITYEFLFDTSASHTSSSFQTAFDANASNSTVPFTGTLTGITSRSFNDVVDGTYYFHLRAYDSDGPLNGSAIVTFGPLVLNSKPTLNSNPVSPASGNHANAVSITISGTRFMSGATAELTGPTNVSGTTAATVTLNSVTRVDSNTITAQVPADIIPGAYDVKVTNAAPFNQAVTATSAFSSTNTAPTANAGVDQVLDLSGSSVNINLNGTGSSDADGDTLASYTWEVLQVASGSSISVGQTYTGSTKSVSVAKTGQYRFGLKVNDGYADSAQDTVNITVQSTAANNPPVASAGSDQMVIAGATVSLAGSATDTDGDTLTYSWAFSSVPTGSTAAFADASSASTTFTADLAGSYTVVLTASDGTDSDTDTLVVTASALSLDVDGDGDGDANDGVMIQRRLTGAGTVTTNISLPTGVGGAGTGGARTNAEVVSVIDSAAGGYDVDGDSDADANDGVMIQRRLTGAGTVTTNVSLPTGVGGSGTSGARTNSEVVSAIDAMTP